MGPTIPAAICELCIKACYEPSDEHPLPCLSPEEAYVQVKCDGSAKLSFNMPTMDTTSMPGKTLCCYHVVCGVGRPMQIDGLLRAARLVASMAWG